LTITQDWRAFSEVLRADYRGVGKLSAYQIMGILAVIYAFALTMILPSEHAVVPQLAAGIDAIWRLEIFLFLQALWVIVFFMFGKSMVTSAQISFHLHHDRI
jgi:hypothetical protein